MAFVFVAIVVEFVARSSFFSCSIPSYLPCGRERAALATDGPALGLIGSTSDLIEGKSTDVDGWLAMASTWSVEAKNLYSSKRQGR